MFLGSGKMRYYTNETFKESKNIGVYISYIDGTPAQLFFTKYCAQCNPCLKMKSSCFITGQDIANLNEELYPCIGFHLAKDVIVRFSGYPMGGSLNDRLKEEIDPPPRFCPFTDKGCKMFDV